MKKIILRIAILCASGLFASAIAQTNIDETSDENGAPDQTGMMPPDDGTPPLEIFAGAMDQAQADGQALPARNETPLPPDRVILPKANTQTGRMNSVGTQSAFVPPNETTNSNPDQLRLNFQNVPLDMVLNYLSDAAGFVIVMDTQVHGTVSVISSRPMTRDEAVDLLNSVLNQNGYAAVRNGRTLTIMNKSDAKTRNIPVKIGNDPGKIPNNDEIVTQIIPIRYVDASQLVSDLSSFVSPQATVVANQAGNSIVITDTQENIRHLVEIIEAIDSSAAGETEIRVFPLRFANPNDVASEMGEIFPSGNSGSGQSQLPIRFGGGGFGGGRGGFFARMAAAAGNNSDNNRAQKQSQVTAVADARTQSVIVMASKDLMSQIGDMIQELDVASPRDQKVYVYHMNNGDPQQALQVLQGMFQNNSTTGRGGASSSSEQTENSALINRANQNATTVGNTSSTISSGLGGGETGTGRGGGSTLP